eukprot:scaffold12222_cov43-Cyclotella_meneghiniana.AAC.3
MLLSISRGKGNRYGRRSSANLPNRCRYESDLPRIFRIDVVFNYRRQASGNLPSQIEAMNQPNLNPCNFRSQKWYSDDESEPRGVAGGSHCERATHQNIIL